MVTSTQPRAGTQGTGAQPCSPDRAQHHELPPPRHQSSGPTESEDGRVETRSRESTVPRPAGPGFRNLYHVAWEQRMLVVGHRCLGSILLRSTIKIFPVVTSLQTETEGGNLPEVPKLCSCVGREQRGQNLASRTPLGTYSLTNRHRAWTPREAGCAPTARSRTRGETLGSETCCLSPGLTAGGLCERTWNMEQVAGTGHVEDRVLF
nr:uncharacterized protein LOC110131402 [Odocoileus virginianus texanus]